MITHTLAGEEYSVGLSAELALQLVATGEIEHCDGYHDNTLPDERVYHVTDGHIFVWSIEAASITGREGMTMIDLHG